jgi:hypothetical protein
MRFISVPKTRLARASAQLPSSHAAPVEALYVALPSEFIIS